MNASCEKYSAEKQLCGIKSVHSRCSAISFVAVIITAAALHVQGAEVLHTQMTTATLITNLVDRSRDDIRVVSEGLPRNVYYMAGWNLTNIATTACHWNVGAYTGFAPANYALDSDRSQVACGPAPFVRSAMQAENFAWGGYMRHWEVPSDGWLQPSLRYAYAFSMATEPKPFTNSSTAKLAFEFNAAVPLYDDYGKAEGSRAIGFGQAVVILIDRKAGVTPQAMHFLLMYFDKRGFSERVCEIGSGEMSVFSYLGSGTKYCTRLGTSDSKTTTWPTLQSFGVTISRAQLLLAINDMNAYLTAHPTNGHRQYSTNPNDYYLSAVNVGIEASLDPNKDGSKYPFSMSYKGIWLSASTIY
ncbi:MAG: hypothetical protein HOO88_05860 [Kiritimatiellaceae bacterium]|nr:hypothetical protein [Kiritimatiellaceae bacterium]